MKVESVKYKLMAQDMTRAIKFYETVFGFKAGFITPFWSELHLGGAILGLHGGGDGSPNPTGLGIQVDDANTACSIITGAGGTIIDKPEQRPGEPIMLGLFRDTEGNEVTLTQFTGMGK